MKKLKEKSDGRNGQAIAAIGDARFARLHSDPRFQRLPKNNSKVSIDSRFKHMFSDKGFHDPVGDKRGKVKKGKKLNILRRYYKVDDDDDDEAEQAESEDGDGEIEGETDRREPTRLVGTAVKEERSNTKRRKRKSSVKDSTKLSRRHQKGTSLQEDEEEEGEEEDENKMSKITKMKANSRLLLTGEELGAQESEAEKSEPENFESHSASSSSSSSDSESEAEELLLTEEEEKVPTTDKETRRLALVNLDWEHIRAVDLFVLLRSFLPKGGRLNSVSVYPSVFGIEQMKEEEVHGPRALFSKQEEAGEDDEQEEEDPEKLRSYEKSRLRYYFAVVDCDSSATAACLYGACDGLEFERTSNTLDLRYIPDGMTFSRSPRDVGKDVPADYKAPIFETKALQHSNVRLTWDDDEPIRVKALRRRFNPDELNELDFRAYIASSSESDSDGEQNGDVSDDCEGMDDKEKVRSRYLSLLDDTDDGGNEKSDKNEKGNIEIKFHTGLDELSDKILQRARKENQDETVWESYLRKKKEKKKARKKEVNGNGDGAKEAGHEDMYTDREDGKEDAFFTHNEDPFNDPFFLDDKEGTDIGQKERKSGKVKNFKKEKKGLKIEEKETEREETNSLKAEEKKRKAELELLLMDDHVLQHGVQAVEKSAKMVSGKRKRKTKQERKGKAKGEDDIQKAPPWADYEDPRFSSLFTSHHFAVDPTDPQFKKTGLYLGSIAERQRSLSLAHQQADVKRGMDVKLNSVDLNEGSGVKDQKGKAELNSIVRSLKAKVKTGKQKQLVR